MSKKGRRKLEEEEAAAFEFPAFDEVAFVNKEYELAWGLAVAGLLTVILGVVAWVLSHNGVSWYVPFAVGILGIIVSPFAIRALRQRSDMYTTGDWAGMIAMEFFGWLALWFVLVNLTGT
jgi:hypothetical protein